MIHFTREIKQTLLGNALVILNKSGNLGVRHELKVAIGRKAIGER
jgi:hypothetical protein